MSKTLSATGQCLCGAVTISAQEANKSINVCHCEMCRKWSGPLIASHCGAKVSIEPSDKVTRFTSSAWAERAFCKDCGTHLFYRIVPSNEYIVPIGLFQDSIDFNLETEIFIDEKPACYSFSNDTKKMTGAEVFAMYAPEQ